MFVSDVTPEALIQYFYAELEVNKLINHAQNLKSEECMRLVKPYFKNESIFFFYMILIIPIHKTWLSLYTMSAR